MKKLTFVIPLLMLSACSSLNPKPEEMKSAKVCTVWKEDTIGIRHPVEVPEEKSSYKVTCWVMNSFLCTYDEYAFKPGTNQISSKLFGDKISAQLDGNKMSVKAIGTTIDPFEIKNGRIEYDIKGPIGPKHRDLVEYNSACSNRQAAVGFLAVMGK